MTDVWDGHMQSFHTTCKADLLRDQIDPVWSSFIRHGFSAHHTVPIERPSLMRFYTGRYHSENREVFVPLATTITYRNALEVFEVKTLMKRNWLLVVCRPDDAAVVDLIGKLNPHIHSVCLRFENKRLSEIHVVLAARYVKERDTDTTERTCVLARFLVRECLHLDKKDTICNDERFKGVVCRKTKYQSNFAERINAMFDRMMKPHVSCRIAFPRSSQRDAIRDFCDEVPVEESAYPLLGCTCDLFFLREDYKRLTDAVTKIPETRFHYLNGSEDQYYHGPEKRVRWQPNAVFRWRYLREQLVEIGLALYPRVDVTYVLVWIYEWFDYVVFTPLHVRVRDAEKIVKSIGKVVDARSLSAKK